MDLSLYINSVPLQYKINLHKYEGEMIYSELIKGALTINKVEKLLEKEATKVK